MGAATFLFEYKLTDNRDLPLPQSQLTQVFNEHLSKGTKIVLLSSINIKNTDPNYSATKLFLK